MQRAAASRILFQLFIFFLFLPISVRWVAIDNDVSMRLRTAD